ncbi:alpha/beta hydrolase [Candidatus Berkelbacteria bacterium]|nr:alpha/beta hydrolase [Candidatus Berkelbacteria bacterium]
MKKRAVIVHCWDGTPEGAWYPWLKAELEARGFEVAVPAMPETETPKIGPWVGTLTTVVGQPDEQTYLIGHSIGCQTVLRYLESLPPGQKVGGVVLVAGFFTLQGIDEEGEMIVRPWLETPIDTDTVRTHADHIEAIFSDNDPWVPVANERLFVDRLGATTHMFHGRGHFSQTDDTTELPEALEAVLHLVERELARE